jgi:hypothetical protein
MTGSPVVIVCRSDMVEHSREPIGDLWCFACRRRTPHDRVVMVERELGYYGPTVTRECSRCHKDRTLFPGHEYAFPEDS